MSGWGPPNWSVSVSGCGTAELVGIGVGLRAAELVGIGVGLGAAELVFIGVGLGAAELVSHYLDLHLLLNGELADFRVPSATGEPDLAHP